MRRERGSRTGQGVISGPVLRRVASASSSRGTLKGESPLSKVHLKVRKLGFQSRIAPVIG